ncbi:dienelactone hydrolase [Bosea sp. TND4EK4]|uniref:alpha/beta hydrolase family protein n=1 Tax=Bosea sp. TND4EK4 TaxID=1907408 RepID=UPI0009555591|nr:dienelactone hydrolase [Bosea sp. TND4EK4]SIQ27441.1 Predicted dienelactone hydrolase [Bosea sp. TND4EK4]
MRLKALVAAAALCCSASLGQAAGLMAFEVPADVSGPALKVLQWSPCARPADTVRLGPFAIPAVRDCPIAGDGKLPLIVISHGFGGTYLAHHDTAEALANAGFVVVALNHPDDNAFNAARFDSLAALRTRPIDVRRLVDHMLGPAPAAARIDPERIGFFGFSRGGYTGLVLAGAQPDIRQLRAVCQDPTGAKCDRIPAGMVPPGEPVSDPRIKAFVIADPLASVFPNGSGLRQIRAPLQLWRSQNGGDGVAPADVAAIAAGLPEKAEFHDAAGAGHFAFLSVCPEALAREQPAICTDAAGFDRAAFHVELNGQAVDFLRRELDRRAGP